MRTPQLSACSGVLCAPPSSWSVRQRKLRRMWEASGLQAARSRSSLTEGPGGGAFIVVEQRQRRSIEKDGNGFISRVGPDGKVEDNGDSGSKKASAPGPTGLALAQTGGQLYAGKTVESILRKSTFAKGRKSSSYYEATRIQVSERPLAMTRGNGLTHPEHGDLTRHLGARGGQAVYSVAGMDTRSKTRKDSSPLDGRRVGSRRGASWPRTSRTKVPGPHDRRSDFFSRDRKKGKCCFLGDPDQRSGNFDGV